MAFGAGEEGEYPEAQVYEHVAPLLEVDGHPWEAAGRAGGAEQTDLHAQIRRAELVVRAEDVVAGLSHQKIFFELSRRSVS